MASDSKIKNKLLPPKKTELNSKISLDKNNKSVITVSFSNKVKSNLSNLKFSNDPV